MCYMYMYMYCQQYPGNVHAFLCVIALIEFWLLSYVCVYVGQWETLGVLQLVTGQFVSQALCSGCVTVVGG